MLKKDIKISPTERKVLIAIGDYESEDMPQRIFSRLKNSTIKRAIGTLKEFGLIKHKPNLKDMRQNYLCITEKGVKLFEEIR